MKSYLNCAHITDISFHLALAVNETNVQLLDIDQLCADLSYW